MEKQSKKFIIEKWLTQFLLGILLSALAGITAFYFRLVDIWQLDVNEDKMEFAKLLIIALIGHNLGIVLGDMSLSKGQKLSILAVITTFFVGLVGYLFCSSHNSVVSWVKHILPTPVLVVIISLITYNAVSHLHRKNLKKLKPKDSVVKTKN